MRNSWRKALVPVLILLGGFLGQLQAQDSLRVMSYNLLFYGTSWHPSNCQPISVTGRNGWFSSIMAELLPDIMGVNEIGGSDAANSPAQNILINVLQPINPAYKRSNVLFNSSTATVNGMFYNSDKVELETHVLIQNSFRPLDYYRFYYQGPGLSLGDTTWIEVVQVHFSADNATSRTTQAQDLMNYLAGLGRAGNFIVMGDMNLDQSTETAYQVMVAHSNPDIKMNDPINLPGTWHDNPSAARSWTQSTRSSSGADCGSGGGLDDRFDIILCSSSLMANADGVRYKPGTYWVPGNPYAPNRAVSPTVFSNMAQLSDHYPVMASLEIDRAVAVEGPQPAQEPLLLLGQPASGTLHLRLGDAWGQDGPLSIQMLDFQGRTLHDWTIALSPERQLDLPVHDLPNGVYWLRLTRVGQAPAMTKVVVLQ